MNSKITVIDFEKICRICLRFEEQLTSITLYNIMRMIQSCSSVQIDSEDDLPHNVCETCLIQLQNAFNFKYLCENSDKELREIIRENKNNCFIDEKIKTENLNCDIRYGVPYLDNNIKDEDQDKVPMISDEKDDNSTDDNFEDKILNDEEDDENEKLEKTVSLKSEKKYVCEICKHVFLETWLLGKHMKRIHQVKGDKCSRCPLVCYHKLHLEEHERSHVEKKVFCDVCNKGFVNRKHLRYHKTSHSTERPYHCTHCDLSFKVRFILTSHIKNVHMSQTYEVCQACGKNVRKSYLERHLKTHEERNLYPCPECSKEFQLEKSLDIHIRRVHQNEELKYTCLCNICGRGIMSRAELKRHIRSHTGEKPFKCDKCDKSYARTGALNHHIKTAHLDQRPCVCTICSQAFHSKNILQNHMKKHTGERPYTCLVCGKSFGFGSVLKTHMKTHAV